MSTPTPLTDADLQQTKTSPGENLWAFADFARDLERRLALAEKERDEARKALAIGIDLVEDWWSFDQAQQHTHSWHDKQDCMEQLRALQPQAAQGDGEAGR